MRPNDSVPVRAVGCKQQKLVIANSSRKGRLSGQLTHLLEGGRDNCGACETRINGPNQTGQAPLLGTDTLSSLLPLSMMAPWVLPPQSWETEPNNLHFLPLLWVTGSSTKAEMTASDWWKLGHMANPELQGRLGTQVASIFNLMKSRFFLKVVGASSSTERRFARHVD